MNKQKGFSVVFILIGILVIAGIAGGGYYFGKLPIKPTTKTEISVTPTAQPVKVDETANWKTYPNPDKGVFFKYPATWELHTLTYEDFSIIRAKTNLVGFVNLGKSDLSMQEVEKLHSYGVKKRENITSNGYPVIRLSGFGGVGNKEYVIDIISNNNATYTFSLSIEDKSLRDSLVSEFDKVFSTFKFIDQSNSISPTCVDEKTGKGMNFDEAEQIARKSDCTQTGSLQEKHFCNSVTGTWWIDLKTFQQKNGCFPACVINVNDKIAEINWRCTGLR